jgi:hypothetical protein
MWMSVLDQSACNLDLLEGQGRVCVSTSGLGESKETITEFDETRLAFSYKSELPSMPFFVREVNNSWRVFKYTRKVSCCQSLSNL